MLELEFVAVFGIVGVIKVHITVDSWVRVGADVGVGIEVGVEDCVDEV